MREIVLLTLVACGPSQVILDYDATIASMRTLVDEHAKAVTSVSTLDEVLPLEEDYQAGWATLMGELGDEMGVMDGCSMAHGKQTVAMGMMDDADDTMGMMDHGMELHMSEHDDHADVSQCAGEEEQHQDTMMDSLDNMGEYGDEWRRSGMSCGEPR